MLLVQGLQVSEVPSAHLSPLLLFHRFVGKFSLLLQRDFCSSAASELWIRCGECVVSLERRFPAVDSTHLVFADCSGGHESSWRPNLFRSVRKASCSILELVFSAMSLFSQILMRASSGSGGLDHHWTSRQPHRDAGEGGQRSTAQDSGRGQRLSLVLMIWQGRSIVFQSWDCRVRSLNSVTEMPKDN